MTKLKGMLEKIGISKTSKKIGENLNTQSDLVNNFQKPGDYGNVVLAPMSYIFTDYGNTTSSQDMQKVFEQITDPVQREEFIRDLQAEYNIIEEQYKSNPEEIIKKFKKLAKKYMKILENYKSNTKKPKVY